MPLKCGYGGSPNGYIDTELFQIWFEKIFIPNCRHGLPRQEPILLLMDNHVSHVQLNIAEKAIKENIHIILIPPHASHFLQPLDMVFSKLKDGIETVAKRLKIINAGMDVC